MRTCRTTETMAILAAGAIILGVVFGRGMAPSPDKSLHRAIGKELAVEALKQLRGSGQITLITRDTENFHQPALDLLVEAFTKEIRRGKAVIGATQSLQVDPLRPLEVPPGDFFETIRRAPAGNVIVSLLGPPVLTEEQRKQLGTIKPRIVAFCPGSIPEYINLGQLFAAGLLHAAIISRPGPSASGKAGRESFDQLYMKLLEPQSTPSPRSPL